MAQYAALEACGIRTPATVAAVGREQIVEAAQSVELPFITKHNRAGKGLGVRLFRDREALARYVAGDEFEPAVDGITLIQRYIEAPEPYITRVEFIGGRYFYAVRVDTSQGFELCPADACRVDDAFCPAGTEPASPASLFSIVDGVPDGLVARYERFLADNRIHIAGIEFILDRNGVPHTYDVNTNTNYNSHAEAAAGRFGMRANRGAPRPRAAGARRSADSRREPVVESQAAGAWSRAAAGDDDERPRTMTQTSNAMSMVIRFAACAALVWGAAGSPLHAQDAAAEIPQLAGVWDGGGRVRPVNGPNMPWVPGENFPVLNERALAYQEVFDEAIAAKYDCVPSTPPALQYDPYMMEVVQWPDRVLFRYEKDDQLRTVWLDGREPTPMDYSLQGVSVGHYEDGSLHVTTTHFTFDVSGFDDYKRHSVVAAQEGDRTLLARGGGVEGDGDGRGRAVPARAGVVHDALAARAGRLQAGAVRVRPGSGADAGEVHGAEVSVTCEVAPARRPDCGACPARVVQVMESCGRRAGR